MSEILISYSHADLSSVEPLATMLSRHGFDVVWDYDFEAGADVGEQIEQQLSSAAVVIVVWTPNSLSSRWVREEASYARDEGKLVPVRMNIDPRDLPPGLAHISSQDLSGWNGKPNDQRVRELKHKLQSLMGKNVSTIADEVATTVITILKKHTNRQAEDIGLSTKLSDLEIESIDLAMIVFDIEDKYGITIPYNAEENNQHLTVGYFVDVIKARLAEVVEKRLA